MAPRHVLLVGLLLALQTRQMVTGRRLLDGPPDAAAAGGPSAAAATTLPASALPLPDAVPYNEGTDAVELKIINGYNVTNSEFDFMVALFQQVPGRQPRFFCGGVLLDNATVLTAAHCVVDTEIVASPSQLLIWYRGTEYPVDQIFAHPGYSADKIPQDNKDLTFDGSLHDLAVVKLSQAIAGDPTTVDVVGEGATLAPGQMLQVAGWGTTETGSTSNVLKFAEVKYLPPSYCPADYDDMVCGGGTGENTCNGDSGGPLLVRDATTRVATVVGVTSHGPDCLSGPNYAYGYYTDVRQYGDAIASWTAGEQIVWPPAETPTNGGAADPTGSGGPPGGNEANAGTAGGDDSLQTPQNEIVWQPVPGTGWVTDPSSEVGSSVGSSEVGSSGGGSSGGGDWSWSSWDDLYCSVFKC